MANVPKLLLALTIGLLVTDPTPALAKPKAKAKGRSIASASISASDATLPTMSCVVERKTEDGITASVLEIAAPSPDLAVATIHSSLAVQAMLSENKFDKKVTAVTCVKAD